MTVLPFELEAIRPAEKGRADFFSWGLYDWLVKRPDHFRIFRGTWNNGNGHDPENPVMYIGKRDIDGEIFGALLRRVCSTGRNPESHWYSAQHHVDEWEDITEEFYQRYMENGVCAIHKDLVHKWLESDDGKTRTCQYCKKQETKHVKIVQVEQVEWV